MLFADAELSAVQTLLQYVILGLTKGSLFALIALGYTMVYGIVELINFAHGDLFMLGSFLALTILGLFGLTDASAEPWKIILALVICFLACPIFCAILNIGVKAGGFVEIALDEREVASAALDRLQH